MEKKFKKKLLQVLLHNMNRVLQLQMEDKEGQLKKKLSLPLVGKFLKFNNKTRSF